MRRSVPLVLLTLCLGLSACSDEPEAPRDDAGAVESEGAVDALELAVGDCVQEPTEASEGVASLTAVPCDQPHDGEVYSTFDLPDGEFPGDEEVAAAGEPQCEEDFAAYVGVPFSESQLSVTTLYPSRETWEQRDDREYVCIALGSEELTASVKDSAQ